MKNYLDFLTEAPINRHMTHLEDSILVLGSAGIKEVDKAMEDFLEAFAGTSKLKNVTTSLKVDGAPACWAGLDPVSNEFFIGTKSMFNASPKINYTHEDIDRNHKGGLADTLHIVLDELKPIWKSNVILQGDVMYTKKILKSESIDGQKYVTFQPNTLKYAVPAEDALAKQISKTNLGIVFHTTYTGPDLQNLSSSFNANIDFIKKSNTVWITDANYNLTGEASFDAAESASFKKLLDSSRKQSGSIDKKFIDYVVSNTQMNMMITTHFNSRIRKGEIVTDPKLHMKDFWSWLTVKFEKELDKLKSEQGKDKRKAIQSVIHKAIKDNEQSLIKLFSYQKTVIDMKEMIINKLNKIKAMQVFVELQPGKYSVTNQEGFTAVDKLSGNAVKLVSRLEFSAQNFNIPKNWK